MPIHGGHYAPMRPHEAPSPEAPTSKAAGVAYVEADPDSLPDELVRVSASAAAHIAARTLGLEPPAIKWFQRVTPQHAAYVKRYFPKLALRRWSGPAGLQGEADRMPKLAGGKLGTIWLYPGLSAAEARMVARHEVCHVGQMLAELPLDEADADHFAEAAA